MHRTVRVGRLHEINDPLMPFLCECCPAWGFLEHSLGCGAEPPSWALIIQGKLIEPQAPSLAGQLSAAPVYQPPSQPFTHYIRRLTAKLDPEQYGDGEEQVVWHKSQHTRNHRDSFEIRCDHLFLRVSVL